MYPVTSFFTTTRNRQQCLEPVPVHVLIPNTDGPRAALCDAPAVPDKATNITLPENVSCVEYYFKIKFQEKMSILNDMTFEKLKSMQVDHISNCMSSTSVLQICRESRADPNNIYNIWVHKLFQAYDISEFQYNDWFQIIAYLKSLAADVIKDTRVNQNTLRTPNLLASTETTINSTKEWKLLSDTQQLITRFETIITNSKTDVAIWSLLISFTLEVFVMLLKTDKKGHVLALVIAQRRLLILITESINTIKVKNGYEFEAVVQVLTILCDVSSLLTSVNFKIAIEGWHAVGKLSYTCQVLSKSFEDGKESLQNGKMIDWSMQPSLKILKEIKKYLHYLQEIVVLHISEDASAHFLGCNFIQDYLTVCLDNHYQHQYFIMNNVKFFLQIFFKLFETPMIYADCRKYNEVLEYYAVLMLLDSSYCLHRHFCKFVLEEKWILAFTSLQVLKIYYSYQHFKMDSYAVSLEFWMKCLGHCTVHKFNERIFFIQDLTKSLIARIPEHILSEQGERLRELLLFVNDKHNASPLSLRFDSDLQKLKKLNGNFTGVITKLNLLIQNPKYINDSIMDSIVQVFEYLLKHRPSCDYSRLQLFFDCCFKLFVNFSLENVNKKIMKCLEENDKNVISICSVFMLEFIIKYRKQLLYKILPEYLGKSLEKVVVLLDVKFINKESQKEELKIFLTLPKLNMELLPLMDYATNFRKNPHQDVRPSYNVKTILNNLLAQSTELKNMRTHFDEEDVHILEKIKHNVDKCYEI
ncbi:hypothetical protein GQX74_010665 [Glossina fuscipes]|nr:hypothetical protein GQX74_010665 [Glossina fuscipes]